MYIRFKQSLVKDKWKQRGKNTYVENFIHEKDTCMFGVLTNVGTEK